MLGKRSDQCGLFEADYLYLDFVGRDSFYGFLAAQRGQMFRDDEFAALYVLDNGRPSVPPSLLATALLLQTHDRVSDEEAAARAALGQEHLATLPGAAHCAQADAGRLPKEPHLRASDRLPHAQEDQNRAGHE